MILEPPLLAAGGQNGDAVFQGISDTQLKPRIRNASFRSRRSVQIMPRKK